MSLVASVRAVPSAIVNPLRGVRCYRHKKSYQRYRSMSLTAEEFYQGMTTQEWLDRIKVNKETILAIFNSVNVPAEDKAFFDGLPGPLRLAIFTEPWCGDAMTTTPPLLQLADATDGLEMKVFERDQVMELTNSFLPANRHGTLPVFVVLDPQMQEVGIFIETARELVPTLDRMAEEIARTRVAPADAQKPASKMSEASRTAIRGGRAAYRVAHAEEWVR